MAKVNKSDTSGIAFKLRYFFGQKTEQRQTSATSKQKRVESAIDVCLASEGRSDGRQRMKGDKQILNCKHLLFAVGLKCLKEKRCWQHTPTKFKKIFVIQNCYIQTEKRLKANIKCRILFADIFYPDMRRNIKNRLMTRNCEKVKMSLRECDWKETL